MRGAVHSELKPARTFSKTLLRDEEADAVLV